MPRSKAILISVAGLVLSSSAPCVAMQELASHGALSASTPEAAAGIVTRPAASPVTTHRWLNVNSLSIAVLFGSEALDSSTTYANLSHPKWICGYSPALGNAVTYISDDGNHYDPHTIQFDLCGSGPSGQLANFAYDVTRTGAFTETGWVRGAGLVSGRNVAGAIAWNVADDVGQMLIARFLSRRRDIFGRVAPGINFARGLVHLDCGIQNLQFARHHSSASTWKFNLPNEENLFPAPRWWGRQ